jgi:hypothetical protein
VKRQFKGYLKSTRLTLERLQLANFHVVLLGEDSRDLPRLNIIGVFLNRIFDPTEFIVSLEDEQIMYEQLDVSSPTKDFLDDFDVSVNRIAEGFKRKSYLSLSRNFERNTLASPLLQMSFAVQEIAKVLNANGRLIVVTDSKLLREVLGQVFDIGLTCRFLVVTQQISKFFKTVSKILVSSLWFVFNRLLTFGITFKKKDLVLINTYLSEEQRVSSRFHDRYFPNLYEKLIETHPDTCYILSGIKWYPRRFVTESNDLQTFLPEFKYYKITDFFKAIRMTFDFGQISQNSFTINGIDLTYLWMRLAEMQIADWESCHFALRTQLMTNLERGGVSVRMLITEFEGMIPEKVLALSLKNTKMQGSHVAVQHNHMTVQLRSFYPLAMDNALGHKPEYIVFMDFGYLREFKRRYPNFAIYRCYSGVDTSARVLIRCSEPNKIEKNIMIVGSVREVENFELIQSVSRTFGKEGYLSFLLLHPALPRDCRIRILDEASKRNIEIYSHGFESALSNFDTFIGSSSGGLLRALFSGKRVIRIATHYCLDMNPFTAISEFLKFKLEVVPEQQNHEVNGTQYCLTNSDVRAPASEYSDSENSKHDLVEILKSLM